MGHARLLPSEEQSVWAESIPALCICDSTHKLRAACPSLLLGIAAHAARAKLQECAIEHLLISCRRKGLHYERPTLSWAPPTQEELLQAQSLEQRMRDQLSAIASFNETERMVLLKQFTTQERWARQQAELLHNPSACAPAGLLTVDQFIAAWHNVSVKVTRRQARVLFFKFGCDAQGLLPYEVFAMKLLSCPARMLALEPEIFGPWKPGPSAVLVATHALCVRAQSHLHAWSSMHQLKVSQMYSSQCKVCGCQYHCQLH
jgi:hypothetical protein